MKTRICYGNIIKKSGGLVEMKVDRNGGTCVGFPCSGCNTLRCPDSGRTIRKRNSDGETVEAVLAGNKETTPGWKIQKTFH